MVAWVHGNDGIITDNIVDCIGSIAEACNAAKHALKQETIAILNN